MPPHLRLPLLSALVLLAALAPAGSAFAKARYAATAAVVVQEDFTYEPGRYPDPCADWTHATGSSRARVIAKGPFIFATAGAFSAGGLSMDATHTQSVIRDVDYRVHVAPFAPPCAPCGPSSELGPCNDSAPPDVTGSSDCAPAAKPDGGKILISLTVKGELVVEPVVQVRDILAACPRPPKGVPYGTADLKPLKRTFRGAARAIRALRPGQEKKFAKAESIGAGCGKTKKKSDARLCTKHELVVRVRRLKDDD